MCYLITNIISISIIFITCILYIKYFLHFYLLQIFYISKYTKIQHNTTQSIIKLKHLSTYFEKKN